MPLAAAAIGNAKPTTSQFKLTNAGGLYLLVKPSDAKLWRLQYRIDGKENAYAIGEYPTAKLSDAGAAREGARKLIKLGIHPAHGRQSGRAAQRVENANTFKAVALEWIDQRKPKWAPYYLRQVDRFMAADVFRCIGAMPIRNVTVADLLAIVKRIEKRGAETVAIRVRQWCSAIYRYAVATPRADTDPAAALKGAIHRPKTEHRKLLERRGFAGKEGAGFSSHGFRSTASTIRNEAGFRPDVIEHQLALAERNKVRGSCNRAEYLEERRAMMQQWAEIAEQMGTGKVVPIKREAA